MLFHHCLCLWLKDTHRATNTSLNSHCHCFWPVLVLFPKVDGSPILTVMSSHAIEDIIVTGFLLDLSCLYQTLPTFDSCLNTIQRTPENQSQEGYKMQTIKLHHSTKKFPLLPSIRFLSGHYLVFPIFIFSPGGVRFRRKLPGAPPECSVRRKERFFLDRYARINI